MEIQDTEPGNECTGYVVAGMAGGGTTFLHKNRDSPAWREGVALVQPEAGFKYLAVQNDSGARSNGYGMTTLSGINDQGVGGATFAAFTSQPRPSDPWLPSAACRFALEGASSAREYVDRFGQVVEEHGIVAGISGGVSPGEGWRIEYGGHKWEADGPYVDDYSPIANAYTIPAMKLDETGGWRRQARLRKAREVLERGLYPNSSGQPWFRQWDIDKAFDFARNQEPLDSPFGGAQGTFGIGAHPGSVFGGSDPRPICDELPYGRPGRCVSAHIAIPDGQHPDYLTVLWWSVDRPTIAPFIPLFIGITKVPEAIAVSEDPDAPFVAADLFNRLRMLLHEHVEHRDLVTSVWRKFEVRQHRAVLDEVVPVVRGHLAEGRDADAHDLLDAFVGAQVDEVVDIATKLVAKLEAYGEAELLPA